MMRKIVLFRLVAVFVFVAGLGTLTVFQSRDHPSHASGPVPTLSIDADPGIAGIQTAATLGSFSPFQVMVNLANAADVRAFNFELTYDKTILSAQTISSGSNLDRNPDANQTVLQATGRAWACSPPAPSGDTGSSPSVGVAFLSCYSTGTPAGPSFDASGAVVATITFTRVGGGTANLALQNVDLFTASGNELGSCNPVVINTATCNSASVTVAVPGTIHITTSPALSPQVIIDGIPRDSWGVWTLLEPGSHTLAFTDPALPFTTPAPRLFNVTSNASTDIAATFAARGYLHVTTSPAFPVTISINGTPRADWGLWTDLSVGTYQVCFGAIADYTPPACQNAQVTAGGNTEVAGTYTSSPGAAGPAPYGLVNVTTSPALPSQVLVDGMESNTYGTWIKLSAGSHTISFKGVPGYSTPAPQNITVVAAAPTQNVVGTFTALGIVRVLTNPAANATIYLDGAAINNWGFWTYVSPGSHAICFGTAPGFANTPPCQPFSIASGASTTITGNYS